MMLPPELMSNSLQTLTVPSGCLERERVVEDEELFSVSGSMLKCGTPELGI